MHLIETAILYSLAGLVVSAALWLDGGEPLRVQRALIALLHLACWPFFAPMLLTGDSKELSSKEDAANVGAQDDAPGGGSQPVPVSLPSEAEESSPLDLDRVEARLSTAFSELEGVAGEVVEAERGRAAELLEAMRTMQARLEEMDELLESPEFDARRVREILEELDASSARGEDPRVESVKNRLHHIERLREMRDRLRAEFEEALFKIDEIGSKIALLKFADRPEEEVGELIEDLAATVEGLSDGLLCA